MLLCCPSGDAGLLPAPGLRPRTWAENEAGRHSPLGSTGQMEKMGHWSCDTKPTARPLPEVISQTPAGGQGFKKNTQLVHKGFT